MSKTLRARIWWLFLSFMTYVLTISLGMNFYYYNENEQISKSCYYLQEKLIKHIEKFGEINDD